MDSTTLQDESGKGAYKQPLKALLPYGVLATRRWLAQQGLNAHAIDNAVKTETLLLLATGVYSQYSRSVSWEGVVALMQRIEKAEGADVPPVYFSCAEKAILELLMDLPSGVTFEHADELMQGLVNLSPRKLDTLLKACKNVKGKRLFFWLAKRQAYPWFSRLNVKDYDLGSGKRVVAKGGKLDTEYLITVPSHMTVDSEG